MNQAFPPAYTTTISGHCNRAGWKFATSNAWLAKFPDAVAAPGQEILTTVPKEGYDFVSGSSLATGHVSAMIALTAGIET